MVDRYTKVVLTVIAISLSILAAQGGVPRAKAQDSINPVQPLQYSGPVHVIVDQWGAYAATLPIPVRAQ